MTVLSYSLPTIGNNNSTEDPIVRSALSAISTWAAGGIDNANIAAAELTRLGLSDGTSIRRGKSNIATTEATTSTTAVTLTTPDQVANIVLPTDGLIVVYFQATWQATVTNNGNAAIYLNSNQAKIASSGTAAPPVQAALTGSTINSDQPLATTVRGLASSNTNTPAYTGDVTTGQICGDANTTGAGGPTTLFAAAGTYTVSIRFWNTAAGTVTVKNRKLWVWTVGF